MKKSNPLHITAQPLAGQQLSSNWRERAIDHGGTFDRRNFADIFQQGTTTKKIEVDSPTRNARLQPLSWNDLYGQK